MAQFFSQAPLDYGARYIAEGYANLAGGIANGINKVSEQRNAAEAMKKQEAARLKELAMQEALREQNRRQGLIDSMEQWRQQQKEGAVFDFAKKQAADRAALEKDARTVGVDLNSPINPTAGKAGWSVVGGSGGYTGNVAGPAGLSDEQRVANAQAKQALDIYGQQRQAAEQAQVEASNQKESVSLKNLRTEAEARGIDVNSKDGKDWLSFQLEMQRAPTDQKYAMLTVSDMVKAGLVKNDRDAIERERARLLPFNGKTPTLTPTQLKAIEDENTLVRNLGSVQNDIAAFEQTYGPGSFDQYSGEVDARTNEWKLRFGASPTEQDKAAGRIAQKFQSVLNADLKATSGGAVTESEAVRKLKEAGPLTGSSFKNSLGGWRDARIMGLQNKQKVLGAFAIPQGLFEYEDAAPVAGAAQPVPASAAVPSGSVDLAAAARAERERRNKGRNP